MIIKNRKLVRRDDLGKIADYIDLDRLKAEAEAAMVWQTDVEDDYYNYEIENIRIIGNIYENPELLEDK